MERVQNHIATEVHDIYKTENVNRRAIETVVRAMGNLTKVDDPGGHPTLLRGEFRPLMAVNRMNHDLQKQGLAPIEHSPALKGIDVMPLAMQEDWLAKLQHNHLRTTIMDAAAVNGVSVIHGAHPIPAVAYGAQFGLTKKDSLTPGQEHLKGVPEHHY